MAQIRFHQLLRSKIEEVYTGELERMAFGYPDYAVYREQVGLLKGLKIALELAEEVEKGMT